MKKIHLTFTIIGTFLINQCGQPNQVEQLELEKSRTFTTVSEDQNLANFKDDIQSQVINGRVNSSLSDRINWNKVYKVDNNQTGLVTYTIPLIVKNPNEFENLVIVTDDDEQHSYLMRYKPDLDWLKAKPRRGGFDSYSGSLEIVNLDGSIRASTEYSNGKPLNEEGKNSGRTSECVEVINLSWTEVCIDGFGCNITEIYWETYIECTGGGGGGGITGGGNTDGSDPGGSDGGDDGGSTGPTPIGGGDPGGVDLVDVSYYLTPLLQGDDLSNPYHGMQATDTNGVVYTYDATIDAWLLPDVVVLAENGYEIDFTNDQFDNNNNFDGAILSTVTTIALVEPTPIGEVIVGGIVLIVLIYEWAQVSTSITEEEWDTCLRLYENLCVGYLCADCLQICRSQHGEWPFEKCPL